MAGRRTPQERTLAAEARAVEAGHRARLDGDGRSFSVKSDTHPGVTYTVRLWAVGETVVFSCSHSCYDQETGRLVEGRSPARTTVPCMHGSTAARSLERRGLLRWEAGRWVPTERAYRLGLTARPAADPFDGLPK